MTEEPKGPATRTRSRTSGSSNGKGQPEFQLETQLSTSKPTKKNFIKTNAGQKLLSDFLIREIDAMHCNSDSELVVKNSLKKRSLSGKVYTSQLAVPAKPLVLEERLGVNSQLARGMDHEMTSDKSNNGNNAIPYPMFVQQLNKRSADMPIKDDSPIAFTTASSVISTTTVSTSQANTGCVITTSSSQPLINTAIQMQGIQNSVDRGSNNNGKMKTTGLGMEQEQEINIATLLQKMDGKLTAIQNDMGSMKQGQTTIKEELAGLQFDQEDDHEAILQQRKELSANQDKVDFLTDLVCKYEDKHQTLTNKYQALEARLMRSELIVFGLKDTSESCVTIFKNFLQNTLELQTLPDITGAYWKGKGDNKPMIVQLSDATQKGLIFANVSNLKEKKNHRNRPYRISDNLPEELAEEQARYRQILAANRDLPDGNQIPMQIKKGKLYVNNSIYQQQVYPPSATEVADTSEALLQEVKEFLMASPDEVTEQKSRFKVYVTSATSLQEVRKKLLHIRKKHSDATHVSVAYRLSGLNKAYDEGCVDDQEIGQGRRILSILQKKAVTDIMSMVVRYYGGTHIGKKRFDIPADLTNQAIDMYSKGDLTRSKLGMRSLQEPAAKLRGKKRVFPSIRGGHKDSPRFMSMAYNRYTLLQSNEAASSDDTTKELQGTNRPDRPSGAFEHLNWINDQTLHAAAPRENWSETTATEMNSDPP